ncbi:glycosyltransferase involved in cell wall biosynthesis [Mucilaginibacter yixingensis]|uniref:Glycosyltransferase involved in cell wall biosynthesis n=1 Tax=Mucilaginibacter yixingensis TaxID=1295612 RepID=A0A2T5JFS1_9SPHI|nr:glycosyltransferase family 2 protein [Mucilaginibacter yixingensis]PTR01280.1 glycosyltransferase involved in cell wall biosynthesis [Mucilaginibacter yixingensis]
MPINLPDLTEYRAAFEAEGVTPPFLEVPVTTNGLLDQLPTPLVDKQGWPWTAQTNAAIYDKCNNWPKLTIVTPSYNQGQFLEQTIRSVLLQNYPNLEYIIIDGGSTDNTVEILEKYSPWISYWHSKKDNGQSHAINMGFSIASGDYYAWINSDDFYLEDTFHTVAKTFLNKKVDFIYGYGYNFKVATQQYHLIQTPPLLDYFLRIPALIQPSCFWRATIHQPLWEELHCSLDYELWQRLVKGHLRKLIKKPLSVANIHDENKTTSPAMSAAWEKDHKLICDKNAHGPVYNWDRIMHLYRFYKKFWGVK